MSDKRYSLHFIPFIRIKRPVKIGDIEFSDLHSCSEEIFRDTDDTIKRNFLEVAKAFKNNYELRTIQNVGIAKHMGNLEFVEDFDGYRDCIETAFSTLCAGQDLILTESVQRLDI